MKIAKSSSGVSCGAVDGRDGSVSEIVVAGGIWYTDKVEIYDVGSASWRDGGKGCNNEDRNTRLHRLRERNKLIHATSWKKGYEKKACRFKCIINKLSEWHFLFCSILQAY